ncbi:MAG: trigger factor [Acidimicrobiia bacterium]|nr:trigger factor [Acidimicrobiia bacterium]
MVVVQEVGGSNPLGHPWCRLVFGRTLFTFTRTGWRCPVTFTITEVSDFERLITILIEKDPLDQAENRAARRLAQNVNINGFRPGKAPRRMVERVVGRERIRHEAIEDLLGTRLAEIWEETGLEPATRPELNDLLEVSEGIEAKISVSLWPSIEEPPHYVGRQIAIEVLEEASDELVDEQLEQVRELHAELEAVERPAQTGDYVSVDIVASKDDAPLERVSSTGLLYELGTFSVFEGLTENLLGKEAGDVVDFESALSDDALPDEVPGLAEGEVIQVRVAIDEVHQKNLPELNDEWAMENYESTLDEIREQIFTRFNQERLSAMRARFRGALLSELMEEIEVDIPSALVDSRTARTWDSFRRDLEEKGFSVEDYLEEDQVDEETLTEEFRSEAKRRLVMGVLFSAVAEQAEITVEPQEVAEIINQIQAHQDEPSPDLFRGERGNAIVNRLYSDILENKVMGVLMRGAVPTDQDGTLIDLEFPPLPTEETVEAEVVEAEVEQGEK